jgi:2-(1,2-epoxy-1,2-dihydrophenyl)acetyl-CoA isomerase
VELVPWAGDRMSWPRSLAEYGDVLQIERTDGRATVTMNRPDRLNALNKALQAALVGGLEDVAGDPTVRSVVLTGAGRGFCAGGELGEVHDAHTWPEASEVGQLRWMVRAVELLIDMPKITIAAINGACAGAGLSLALACDIRVASERAVFNTAFLTAGLPGDYGSAWLLSRLVGEARARDLLLFPRKFTAQEALGMGLVSRLVPEGEFEETVVTLATGAAASAPLAVRGMKANLRAASVLQLGDYLSVETERQIQCGRSEDAAEAGQAFLAKRPPQFAGR